MIKSKDLFLDEIQNSAVETFFIWICLGVQISISESSEVRGVTREVWGTTTCAYLSQNENSLEMI
jgi:imidazoleglycerol phosphate synthase glutamine amidotransferase subunit HisH